ncbi:hypothetical protein Ae406Ps2_5830 [Pseudonocardia sp. Ae406_Ps2]|nr:hypothetical protein Ae331Ps2_0129c [Pseudonocardia sp. Ae331_Ps2]OLM05830.1 hypothetical protein Ae406Ps2_5830 [Pseudonocardia sp. Ae406_Ps2]OLM15011.1 hypothetical protein Ae505Ps2_5143c [Pseudonocardia sp. Ae505_Ps2]OLM27405.1 hypothetical protein Ae706Ps2_5839 [Pseudonocardia sp. Ae706_Ps2]
MLRRAVDVPGAPPAAVPPVAAHGASADSTG